LNTKDIGYSIAPPFTDSRNITVGCGRVIWADSGRKYGVGWVLPGCIITQDKDVAIAMATTIDYLSQTQ